LNAQVAAWRRGEDRRQPRSWPRGSIGEAWDKWRETAVWQRKSLARRRELERSWEDIAPIFGDCAPASVGLAEISALQDHVRGSVSDHEAWRVVKNWRSLWQAMAWLKAPGVTSDNDPSFGIRNTAPKGRSATWTEGEATRLCKEAWRQGYHGLAAIIAVIWDTMVSPGDARQLTLAQARSDGRRVWFDLARCKTGRATLATLQPRAQAALEAYLGRMEIEILPDAPLFRHRSGAPYTKDKLTQDFRYIRRACFGPQEDRKLLDLRRSGAVEAQAGEADPSALAAKMGNSIDKAKQLQATYLPSRLAVIDTADQARLRGRRRLRAMNEAGAKVSHLRPRKSLNPPRGAAKSLK